MPWNRCSQSQHAVILGLVLGRVQDLERAVNVVALIGSSGRLPLKLKNITFDFKRGDFAEMRGTESSQRGDSRVRSLEAAGKLF